eukprot:GFUD01034575.1.p1 GENE.GFUD01034575.1~~GFUD01034575.1.p1  ORF type:complete len:395 (+),score=105.87 GFUD01034575.1:55-1185(+)
MSGYPVTPGYTINIVKDKKQPAVILLNSASTNKGAKTFYITVPRPGPDEGGTGDTSDNGDIGLENLLVKNGKRKGTDDDIFYFVEDSTEEVISSEVIVEEDGSYVGDVERNNFEVRLAESSDTDQTCEVKDSNSVVYFEENNSSYTDSSVFFTEVAHEEIVIEEVLIDNIVEERQSNSRSRTIISNVQCDLCNSKLNSAEDAKIHMRQVHNILTYDGPFFKCEFCGIFVTDRVSHMKVAHYSPLAQAFCKTNNAYQCLQCEYTSDQLTNIRNHVDAKHSSGENKYLCEECNSEYKTLNSMRAHKSRVHVKKRRLIELNQLSAASVRDPMVDKVVSVRDPLVSKVVSANRNQKLQKEIMELEQKTFSKFVNRSIDWS